MTAVAPSAPASAAEHGHRGAIIVMCQHFYPEMISTGMHMTELAVALTRRGWRVSVVCAQPSLLLSETNVAVPRAMTHEGITITRVATIGSHSSLAGRALFAFSFVLTSMVRALRLRYGARGIVLTTNPPFLGLGAWVLSRLRVLPYVLIVYDVYPEIASRLGVLKEGSFIEQLWQRATRLVLNEAAAVVVIGRDMERIIAAKVRPGQRGRLHLIPNWSDADAVAPVPASGTPSSPSTNWAVGSWCSMRVGWAVPTTSNHSWKLRHYCATGPSSFSSSATEPSAP